MTTRNEAGLGLLIAMHLDRLLFPVAIVLALGAALQLTAP
ncbi:hypothetical protein FHS00_000414 [Limimaricola variabilis]|jgi:hypothetical protein|uniref:Uncharacterized protein n=1 Tax=Limimaricola variabilis TaxID=1492771 RepID=A0ABR6HKA8_9RHOB|nr:hypothetical protein [Limimaricola variabilis]